MEKPIVKDPIAYYDTVGQEVIKIASIHSIDLDKIYSEISIRRPLQDIEAFSEKDLLAISKVLNIEGINEFLHNSQISYKKIKERTRAKCNEYRKIYTQLKHIEEIIPAFFDEGEDKLNNIMYFLDLDDEFKIEENAEGVLYADFKKPTIQISPVNTLALIRKSEIEFSTKKFPKYNKEGLMNWIETSNNWKSNLYNLNYIHNDLVEDLFQYGIHLSLSKALPKSIYGATKWIDNTPLITITDRDKNLAVFWNTLFHELGHAVLHQENTNFDIEKDKSKREKEANSFVDCYLHNNVDLNSYVHGLVRKGEIIDSINLSKELGIEHIFILYRMNKARGLRLHLDKLKYNSYKLEFS